MSVPKLGPKSADRLLPTPILQQTALWGKVKSRTGWESSAFDILGKESAQADLLLVSRRLSKDQSLAYAPFGPEYLPDDESRGPYLEALSEELRGHLPADCAFIRYDLPWESPYAQDSARYDENGHWLGPPESRIRELRMNFGSRKGLLRKAYSDIMPPDTIIIDLDIDAQSILARMHHSTRRNIRLSERRGVEVHEAARGEELDEWYGLYRETAARDGFFLHDKSHFEAVLREGAAPRDRAGGSAQVRLIMARRAARPVAGIFLAISERRATYLYGASNHDARDCRASYALQWAAITIAKAQGCLEYDLFGCAPRPDPDHPLYGLWRFKVGFGGRLVHRQGCWDYPLKPEVYAAWRSQEIAADGFHV